MLVEYSLLLERQCNIYIYIYIYIYIILISEILPLGISEPEVTLRRLRTIFVGLMKSNKVQLGTVGNGNYWSRRILGFRHQEADLRYFRPKPQMRIGRIYIYKDC